MWTRSNFSGQAHGFVIASASVFLADNFASRVAVTSYLLRRSSAGPTSQAAEIGSHTKP